MTWCVGRDLRQTLNIGLFKGFAAASQSQGVCAADTTITSEVRNSPSNFLDQGGGKQLQTITPHHAVLSSAVLPDLLSECAPLK